MPLLGTYDKNKGTETNADDKKKVEARKRTYINEKLYRNTAP